MYTRHPSSHDQNHSRHVSHPGTSHSADPSATECAYEATTHPSRRDEEGNGASQLSCHRTNHDIRFRWLARKPQAAGLATNSAWNHSRSSQLTQTRTWTRTTRTNSISGPFHEYIAIQPSDHSTCPRAKPARTVMAGQQASRRSLHPNQTASSNAHCVASDVIPPSPRIKRYAHDRWRSKQRIEPGREPSPRLRNLENPANI